MRTIMERGREDMRREEADAWRKKAQKALDGGDPETAIACLRRAAALYKALEETETADAWPHAETCRRLRDLLAEAGNLPEAMQAYQEAADAYGRVPGAEAEAQECARR